MEVINHTFEKKGYFAALSVALGLGLSLAEAEDYIGRLRLAKIEASEELVAS